MGLVYGPAQLVGFTNQLEPDHDFPHRSADDSLRELAAALAHEIKNPAALALAHVAQLRRRADLTGIGDACDHIEEALEKICCLVQEMLFATYGAAPAYEFDIADNLMDMLEAYQAAWPNINFSLEAPAEGLTLHGEEAYVGIVFSNLLKNAVEATGGSGHVLINISAGHGHGIISVADSGTGVGGIKPHPSGLGLAICKWLLSRMGGRLEMESRAVGCEARVFLPLGV